MSKVLMNRVFVKDTFKVAAATVLTGWKPGQFFTVNSNGNGEAILANGDNAMFMGVDDPTLPLNSTLSLASPPTGSLLTGIYGVGSKVYIDHTLEVALGDPNRAYAADVELGTPGASLWVNAGGKLSLSGSVVGSGVGYTSGSVSSAVAKLLQVPSATNNYTIGVLFRI
jgi:hypothetical protein